MLRVRPTTGRDVGTRLIERCATYIYHQRTRKPAVDLIGQGVDRRQIPVRVVAHEPEFARLLGVPEPDPAATVLALRPAGETFEVLMVHRNSRGFFGDIVVFPGGKVDEIDCPEGLDRYHDMSHRNAAVRELAEETGILITDDGPVAVPQVKDGEFYEWVRSIEAATDQLVLVSRWVTPEHAPRRFDTRFYVVACLDPPDVRIDNDELVGYEWVTPIDALERHQRGDWPMIRPTITHLRWLCRWASIEDALDSARGADGRTVSKVEDGSLLPIHMPAEPT